MSQNAIRSLLLVLLVLLVPLSRMEAGNTYADIAKAQMVIAEIQKIVDKYNKLTIDLEPPEPIHGNSGKFYCPFKEDGSLTEWANKALNVQAGAYAGEKAGSAAGKALASKVPLGGLMSNKIKKQGKKMGAMAAIGGDKFVKKTTALSFGSLDELIVYLHAAERGNPDYQSAVASAMAIYPDMQSRVDYAINQAYKKAAKAQKEAAKAAKKKSK
ncbi:hypothetical protein [Pelagicoccus mobilis]|uniref:Uncharacterized protein n=1 Tax=Pelagicoccus mobilis TaxID=415221 RepID=A0A934S3Y1_9BACT|nr:hypothetical protein [Pelagicoccus mobilis]MBK1880634.1 hypothetical protein [Pelagicoccus mobilis]